MYTTSQDWLKSTSTAVHAGDIAITLSEDRLLNPVNVQARFNIISLYTTFYIFFGYVLFTSWFMLVMFSKNMKHLYLNQCQLLLRIIMTLFYL